MDTNVFISELRREDIFHSEARTITKKLGSKDIRAHTSVLTLVEVASVASRLCQSGSEKIKTAEEAQVFVIKWIQRLASLNVEFVHLSGDLRLSLTGVETLLPSLFNEAILISLLSPLRTFDLMHIAAARYARQENPDLRALVTGDNEFIRRKRELSKIIGMPLLSPKEYVQALGLD